MNGWQLAKQIRYMLRKLRWSETPQELVFAGVHITAGTKERAASLVGLPLTLINVGGFKSDDQAPELTTQRIGLVLICANLNDDLGEASLIGANRAEVSGQGRSEGRGLLEVESVMLREVREILGARGAHITVASAEGVEPAELGEGLWADAREYTLEGLATMDEYYHAPTALVATAAGGGVVNLSWTLPPDRYDRRRIILRRASGAVPPASPTAGTGVTLGGLLATSVADNPGAGTFSYAIFAAYDETESGTDERWSAAAIGTTRTLAVT